MDPVTGALISGGSSILGGAIQGFWGAQNANSAANQNQQNAWLNAQWNLAAQQQNQQWLEQMSNTAYQRATKDMRAAGLNPALMYGSGSAASTPSSSPAQMNMPTNRPVPPSSDPITPAVSSALQAYSTIQSMEKMKAEVDNVKEANQLIAAQAHDANASAQLKWAQIPGADKEPAFKIAATTAAAASARASSARAALDEQEALSVGKYGFGANSPHSTLRHAQGNAAALLEHLWGKVSSALPPFSSSMLTAREAAVGERNPEYRNGRIGRPFQDGDMSWSLSP